jgi:hypothetical protein
MKFLRILGILILIAGIGCIFASNYITSQVNQGKIQIAHGEKAVSQGQQLFSFNPVAKQVGQGLTNSAGKKIKEGKQQISEYEALAAQLMTGGIVGCILGAGFIITSFFVKGKKSR